MIFPLINDNCIYQVVNEFVKNDYESHNIGVEYGFSDNLSNEFDLDDQIYSKIGDGIYAKYKLIARVHQAFGVKCTCEVDTLTNTGNKQLNEIITISDLVEVISLKLHGVE